jgi:tetratricopeptide (TPR) repeat protein
LKLNYFDKKIQNIEGLVYNTNMNYTLFIKQRIINTTKIIFLLQFRNLNYIKQSNRFDVKIFAFSIILILSLTILISNSLDKNVVFGQTNKINDNATNMVSQYFQNGFALFKLGKSNESIPYFDKILSINPNNAAALNYKGFALVKLGKYNESIPYFDKILSINPNNTAIIYDKGYALFKLGKYNESIPYFNKVLPSQ